MDLPFFSPIILLITIGAVVVVIATIALSKNRAQMQQTTRYHSSRRQTYMPGEFSSQMELDLRLPYRRFKKLYPDSKFTYEEYKGLQKKTAFRRSISSQENKRMVR